MVNSRLRKRSGYDTSGWLSSEGTMNDAMFLEEVDIALGHVWTADAEFPEDAIDTYEIYRDVSAFPNAPDGRSQP